MSRGKIVVTSAGLHERALQMITDLGYQSIQAPACSDEESLRSFIERVDPVAILVRIGSISAAVIGAAPSLRVISKHGAGVDNIDIGAAASRGIPVVVTKGANSQAAAEHTLSLTLAVVKDLVLLDMSVRDGRWEKSSFRGREFRGMKLGLVGFGAIAQSFAPLAKAVEMSVQAYDPFVADSDFETASVERAERLEILLQQADIVSLHCPLTAENKCLINATTIASMKRGSFVINTARGGLIDEDALIAALQSGQIAAAGLDTFAQEPPRKGHPYFDLPNVVLTPHIAGCTEKSMERVGTDAVLGIHAVLSDEELPPARIANSKELASASDTDINKPSGH